MSMFGSRRESPAHAMDLGVPMWGDPQEEEAPKKPRAEEPAPDEDAISRAVSRMEESGLFGEEEGESEEAEPQEAAAPEKETEEPEAREAAEPDRIRQLEDEIRGLRAHLQGGGQTQGVDPRQIAQAMFEAERYRKQWSDSQKGAEAPSIEEVIGMDMEDVLSDPAKAQKALERLGKSYGEWGYRRAQAEVMPYLQHLQGLTSMVSKSIPILADGAVRKAREMAESTKLLSGSEFDKIRDKALGLIDQQLGPQAAEARMDPQVILSAAQAVINHEGRPVVEEAKKAPSAGQGSSTAQGASKPSGRKRRALRSVEKKLGMKFRPETVRQFNERWEKRAS